VLPSLWELTLNHNELTELNRNIVYLERLSLDPPTPFGFIDV